MKYNHTNAILRTVYIDQPTDDLLRARAHRTGERKGDIIVLAVSLLVETVNLSDKLAAEFRKPEIKRIDTDWLGVLRTLQPAGAAL